MPRPKGAKQLDDERRRRITLAALARHSDGEVAREYGVIRQRVQQLRTEAERNYPEELAYWEAVRDAVEGDG